MIKRFELGLAKDYISDWTVSNAIREFMQNAIDQANGHPDNAYSVEYNAEEQELRIANKASVLEKSTLLLGTTTKGENDIGGFGEGYKLACLVMLRNNIKVRFENYGAREIWNFKFSKLKKYDYVESLVCDVETQAFFKKVPNNNLTIVLSGITEEQHQQYLDLLIDKNCSVIDTEEGRILKTPAYKGKVYVNGLYVASLPNFYFGYDLKPKFIQIGRDRNLINSYDLSRVTKNMWLKSGENKLIKEMLAKDAPDVSYLSSEYGGWDYDSVTRPARASLADDIYSEIQEEYGEGVLLASSEEEKETLENTTDSKIVYVPSSLSNVVKQASTTYSNVLNQAKTEAENRERTVKEKIYAWGLKHRVDTDYLHELFDILGDRVDATVDDMTSDNRDECIYVYQAARYKDAIYEALMDDSHICEALGLDEDDLDEDLLAIKCRELVEEIYLPSIKELRYNDEREAVMDHMSDLLDEVSEYVRNYLIDRIEAIKEAAEQAEETETVDA